MKHEHILAVGVFSTRDQAELAITELRRAGFGDEQIGMATRIQATQLGMRMAAGAVGGGALGAVAGLAAISAAIPVVGPVLVAGMLAGAVVGGIVGAFAEQGLTAETARFYERELAAGRTIVTVRSNGHRAEAVAILRRCGAYDHTDRRPPIGAAPVGLA